MTWDSPWQLLADPDEGPLARPFLAGTATDADRARYRDWLLARGDRRGELLAALDALLAPVAPPDAAALRARLAELSAQVPEFWLAIVRPVADVYNCGEAIGAAPAVRFAYECPRTWASLEPTADPAVRRCDGCGEAVTLCTTLEQAEAHARIGACITVPSAIAQEAHDRYTRMITGRPHLPSVWARRIFG